MGQQSTLRRIVHTNLRQQGIDLDTLLAQYPTRSFSDLRQTIEAQTGIALSARTVRRWFLNGTTQAKEAS